MMSKWVLTAAVMMFFALALAACSGDGNADLGKVEARLGKVQGDLVRVEARLENVEADLGKVQGDLVRVEARLENIEADEVGWINKLINRIGAIGGIISIVHSTGLLFR